MRDVHATEHTVTARLAFACYGYRCHRIVRKGEDYIRLVAFPRHEANGGTTPWVLKLCVPCYREHDEERPMPPRKTTHPIAAVVVAGAGEQQEEA